MEVASEQPKANGSKAFLGTDEVSRYGGRPFTAGLEGNFPFQNSGDSKGFGLFPKKHTMHVILRDTGGMCLSTGNLFQM